jgi:hypothetical protein
MPSRTDPEIGMEPTYKTTLDQSVHYSHNTEVKLVGWIIGQVISWL